MQSIESCEFDSGPGSNGRIGIVLVAGELTLEHELALILSPRNIGLHYTRVASEDEVTTENLLKTKQKIGNAVQLLVPAVKLDVLAFACTSAACSIGETDVFAELARREEHAIKSSPITGMLKACKSLNVKRLALLTPYIGELNETVVRYIEKHSNVKVAHISTFNLLSEVQIAHVTPHSIRQAAVHVGSRHDVDAVFISCTNLRVAEVAKSVERQIKKPCLSSNLVLAWHFLRALNLSVDLSEQYGVLFSK